MTQSIEDRRAYQRAYKKRMRAAGLLRDHGRKKVRGLKAELCMRARRRARDRGLEATVRHFDLHWPTHCPVLGMPLDYETKRGERTANLDNLPTLDRWDNEKGYTPGNVHVISYRANRIKSNATAEELAAVAEYARSGVW